MPSLSELSLGLLVAVAGAVVIDVLLSFGPRVVRAIKVENENDDDEDKASVEQTKSLRLLQVNVWSGSTYEIDWSKLKFAMYEPPAATERRYEILLRRIRELDPDVVTVNEAMPCEAYVTRLASDLNMDAVYHLGVAGIVLGRFLRFPCISEGDAVLAKVGLLLLLYARGKWIHHSTHLCR